MQYINICLKYIWFKEAMFKYVVCFSVHLSRFVAVFMVSGQQVTQSIQVQTHHSGLLTHCVYNVTYNKT